MSTKGDTAYLLAGAAGGVLIGFLFGHEAGSARVQKRVDACEALAKESRRQDTIREWRRDCREQVDAVQGREFYVEQCVRQKEAEAWK